MRNQRPIQASFSDRFWKYVRKTRTCWLWTGAIGTNGRGTLRIGRASDGREPSNRASWIVHHGSIPAGMFVLHHCDNAICVRPDHLYIGTQQDNMRDRTLRKRHYMHGHGELVSGERNPRAKLTREMVADIRKRSAAGESGASLGKEYGVTKENIYRIVKNRTWIMAA